MGVGDQHGRAPAAQERDGGAGALVALAALQRIDIRGDERALGDEPLDRRQPGFEDVAAALRMGEQKSESTPAKLAGAVEERGVDALEGDLEEHPARAGRPVGDRLELGVGERADRLGLELAADADVERDALPGERRAQLGHALGQLVDDDLLDVRRGDDDARAGGRRHAGVGDALVERPGAVVDAGEDVAVEVDHLLELPPPPAGLPRRPRDPGEGVRPAARPSS